MLAHQRQHSSRIPIDVSTDGEWLGHTYHSYESLTGSIFSDSGVPGTDSFKRVQADLTNVRTGEVIHLGKADSSSWAPVWSPDGRRVAYYSDEDGESGLWIWERSTKTAARFPGVIVRPYFGFETVNWSADGSRLVCQVLPPGVSLAQANAALPDPENPEAIRFKQVADDAPSVVVYKTPGADVAPAGAQGLGYMSAGFDTDLAILDPHSQTVVRVAQRIRSRWSRFSPDGRYLAYTQWH